MIVDTHLHIIDQSALRYPWLSGAPALNRDFSYADYAREAKRCGITDVVFMAVDVDPADIDREIEYVKGKAEAAGSLMFYGAGAGGVQTASAVLGDVVSAARRHIAGGVGVGESTLANLPTVPVGRVTTRYQITLEVDDRPGVLAEVAGILSDGRVSIATVEQTVIGDGDTVPPAEPGASTGSGTGSARLVIGTHKAREQDLSETVERLAGSGVVERVVSVLRVEGD